MNNFELPKRGEYPEYFDSYLGKIGEGHYSDLIQSQIHDIKSLFASKPSGWESIAYGPGKWSPKEVLGHIIDTERIMLFRALCIARGERQSLPGFDENEYVTHGRFAEISLENLLEDFEAQRLAICSFVKTLSVNSLDHLGKANEKPITPRALLWIIPGHFIHHLQILNERYL